LQRQQVAVKLPFHTVSHPLMLYATQQQQQLQLQLLSLCLRAVQLKQEFTEPYLETRDTDSFILYFLLLLRMCSVACRNEGVTSSSPFSSALRSDFMKQIFGWGGKFIIFLTKFLPFDDFNMANSWPKSTTL